MLHVAIGSVAALQAADELAIVAPIALLLASDAGRYINGQAIVVDGGFQVA